MILLIAICFWALQAPAGWVIGGEYANHIKLDDATGYRFVCAIFPPATAILAIIIIINEETS